MQSNIDVVNKKEMKPKGYKFDRTRDNGEVAILEGDSGVFYKVVDGMRPEENNVEDWIEFRDWVVVEQGKNTVNEVGTLMFQPFDYVVTSFGSTVMNENVSFKPSCSSSNELVCYGKTANCGPIYFTLHTSNKPKISVEEYDKFGYNPDKGSLPVYMNSVFDDLEHLYNEEVNNKSIDNTVSLLQQNMSDSLSQEIIFSLDKYSQPDIRLSFNRLMVSTVKDR